MTDNRKCQNKRLGAMISGCPSLSQSLGYTFIEFVIVENAGLAARILTLCAIVPDI